MQSPLLSPRSVHRVRRWAFLTALLAWLGLSVLFLTHLSVFERWRQSRSPFSGVGEPDISDKEWSLPKGLSGSLAGGAAAWGAHLHQKTKAQDALPQQGAPALNLAEPLPVPPNTAPRQSAGQAIAAFSLPKVSPALTKEKGASDGKVEVPVQPIPSTHAGIQGTSERAGTDNGGTQKPGVTILTSTPQRHWQSASGVPVDRRVSGLGPKLDSAALHGGWQVTREVFDQALAHPNATLLSRHSPRLLLVRGFLAPHEVEHLVWLATGDLARSQVVSDNASQQASRTSYGSWLNGAKRDAKVLEIQHHIHSLVGIPEEFGESLYVLRYDLGQKYEAHTDHCALRKGVAGRDACRTFLERSGGPRCGPGAGGVTCGDRLATFIIYLRAPEEGGATVFPNTRPATLTHEPSKSPPYASPGKGTLASSMAAQRGSSSSSSSSSRVGSKEQAVAPDQQLEQDSIAYGGQDLWDTRAASLRRVKEDASQQAAAPAPAPPYCDDRAGVLQVAPAAGDALLFWDYAPKDAPPHTQEDPAAVLDVHPDPSSLHGGCPVVKGTKYIVTRWIRSAEFH